MQQIPQIVILVAYDGRGGIARSINAHGTETTFELARKIARRAAAVLRASKRRVGQLRHNGYTKSPPPEQAYDTNFIIHRAHVRLIIANFDVPEIADGLYRPFPELIDAILRAKAPAKAGA